MPIIMEFPKQPELPDVLGEQESMSAWLVAHMTDSERVVHYHDRLGKACKTGSMQCVACGTRFNDHSKPRVSVHCPICGRSHYRQL
jgi:hypothetical protein